MKVKKHIFFLPLNNCLRMTLELKNIEFVFSKDGNTNFNKIAFI